MRLLLPLLVLGGAAVARRPESPKDLSHANHFPILDIGAAHIWAAENGTTPALANAFFAGEETPCGPTRPCSDGACCNKGGNCGYGPEYCSKDGPAFCQSNCDAKAQCGRYSWNGKVVCPLNLCCSDYGYCGYEEQYCNLNQDKPCQKDFGGCEVRQQPSCGKDSNTATNGRRIGYYASWNVRNRQCNRFWPKHIKAATFTHLIFAFASMDPKTFEMVPADPADVALYEQFTGLKSATLRTWIGVGGWEFSENHTSTRWAWTDMASKKENRAAFIKSAMAFMDRYGFEGLDLDWEYPSAADRNGKPEDKENYKALVREMREAFQARFGISVAIPASFPYMQGFDLKYMAPYIDWFNLMSYDLHGTWDANFAGLGPNMLPHTSLTELDRLLKPLWYAQVDPKKINMGLARYGRGFTVKDKQCMNLGCEFLGGNKAGPCTNTESTLSNQEIHELIKEKGLVPEFVKDHGVKVIKYDDQWIAYDDYETFELKKEYANDRCFGGIFVWELTQAGKGSGGRPNLDRDPTGENNDGQHFDSDVFPHQDTWVNKEPRVQCIPPCTLILPPFRLPSPTTISWPPFATTFLSIGGGQTGTSFNTKETIIGGVVTLKTTVVITVDGATISTLTSVVSVPPFTTDKLDFFPVYVEPSDSAGAVFVPVPSVTPPILTLKLPPGVRTFPPSRFTYPDGPTPTRSTSSPTPLWFEFPVTSHPWTIRPQPTVFIPLPTDLPGPPADCNSTQSISSDLPQSCKTDQWPTAVTFFPFPPEKTCDVARDCGHKECIAFGCGCGPENLPSGPGCNTGCKGSINHPEDVVICDNPDDDSDYDTDDYQNHRKEDDDVDDRRHREKKDKKKKGEKDDKDRKNDDDDDDNDDDDNNTDEDSDEEVKDDSGKGPKSKHGPKRPSPKFPKIPKIPKIPGIPKIPKIPGLPKPPGFPKPPPPPPGPPNGPPDPSKGPPNGPPDPTNGPNPTPGPNPSNGPTPAPGPTPTPFPNPTPSPPPPGSWEPPPPTYTPPLNEPCGISGCGGGCGVFGCPGRCGIGCCGNKGIANRCETCPLSICGPPECRINPNKCKPPPGYPTGGPPDKKPDDCEEELKTRVTDYFISCTNFDATSSSCKTTFSVVHTGCAITGTKTTTRKGPGCTRAPLNLDDDQGDNEGDPATKTKTSDEPEPTKEPDRDPPIWEKRKCGAGLCGCCLDYYYYCKEAQEACKGKDSKGRDNRGDRACIANCQNLMCWGDESPKICHYGEMCGTQMDVCPEPVNGRAPKLIEVPKNA